MPKTPNRINATFNVHIADVLGAVRRVPIDKTIRRDLVDTRLLLRRLSRYADDFAGKLKDLESQDQLSTFEINDLMNRYNQAETLASAVRKKADCTGSAIISKI